MVCPAQIMECIQSVQVVRPTVRGKEVPRPFQVTDGLGNMSDSPKAIPNGQEQFRLDERLFREERFDPVGSQLRTGTLQEDTDLRIKCSICSGASQLHQEFVLRPDIALSQQSVQQETSHGFMNALLLL